MVAVLGVSEIKDCRDCDHSQVAYESVLCCKGSVILAQAARHSQGTCLPKAIHFKPKQRRKG